MKRAMIKDLTLEHVSFSGEFHMIIKSKIRHMKKIFIPLAVLSILFGCKTKTEESVTWVSTTENSPWQEEQIYTGQAKDNAIEIYSNDPLQTIDGFGACFNELGYTSLSMLSQSQRDSIMKELFEPGNGANFTYCRMPVAANDFARDWYSYTETDGDFAMKNFSIANDEETLIPFIKSAQKYNSDLNIWASPWSPPQWMKYNKHYAENMVPGVIEGVENGIKPEQVGKEGTDMFIQEPKYFEAYALYFQKFIEAYKVYGIDIDMVMPQNEFNSAQWYPSCTWTPEGLEKFIKVLAPKMDSLGVKTFFGTMERPNTSLFADVYKNETNLIDGFGAQWAGKEAVAEIHKRYPDLKIYQTEHECGNGENSWAYAEYGWDLMKHYFLNGANAYLYWNISLKEGGLSRWGWKQNSLVSVNDSTKSFKWTNDYYLMKHMSHFVQPGSQMLNTSSKPTIKHRNDVLGWWEGDLTSNNDNLLAFKNTDGSVAVIVYNEEESSKTINLTVGENTIHPTLKAKSFNSFLFR